MISDNNGGVILVWQGYTSDITNTSEIYAQNVCSNGQLGNNCLLGIKDINLINNFILYPNPTNSILYLQFKNEVIIDKIIITDVSGKKILEQTHNNSQINVESLANGLYIIEGFSQGKKFKTKFIKE